MYQIKFTSAYKKSYKLMKKYYNILFLIYQQTCASLGRRIQMETSIQIAISRG